MAEDQEGAFPWPGGDMINQGMSLRDYFAAKAMAGTLATEQSVLTDGEVIETRDGGYQDAVADFAYGMADIMMERRTKKD